MSNIHIIHINPSFQVLQSHIKTTKTQNKPWKYTHTHTRIDTDMDMDTNKHTQLADPIYRNGLCVS